MKNTQNISVDITARNTNPPPIVTAKQFDNTSRKVIATIYDNGILASVPSTATISVYFGGIKGNDTCYIDGLTATDSKVEFIIPQTALLMFGEVPCEIQISENDEIIATMNFFIKVEKSVYSDDAAVGEDNGNVIIPAIEALKKTEALEYKFDEESQKTSALQNFPRIVEMNVEDSGAFTVKLISGEVTPTFTTLTYDIDMTRLNNAAYLVKYKRPDSSWLLVDATAIQSSKYDPSNYTHYCIADFVIDTVNSKIINYYPHYLSGSFSKLDSYIGNKANIPYGIELRIVDDTNVKVRYFINDLRNGTAELIVKSIDINTFFSSGLSTENDVYFWYANNKWVIGDSQAYVDDNGLPIYDKFHIASVFVENGKVTDFIAYDGINAKRYTDKILDSKANIGYTNNTFSNAIKGNGTGTALTFDDVSPISHKVGLSGIAGSTVNICGLNIMPKNYVDGGFNTIGSKWESGSMPGYSYFPIFYGQKLRLIIDGEAKQCRYKILDKDKNTIKALDNTKVAEGHVININVEGAAFLTFRFLSNEYTEDGVTHEFMLIEGAGEIPDYEPYKGTQTITLDENGKGEAESVAPNMTVVSDSDVEVEYNRDASKIINQLIIDNANLKNAVISLGGSL